MISSLENAKIHIVFQKIKLFPCFLKDLSIYCPSILSVSFFFRNIASQNLNFFYQYRETGTENENEAFFHRHCGVFLMS